MKKPYKYLAILLTAGALTSCNDWLDDVKTTANIDDVATWSQESSVQAQVDYFYRYLASWGQFGDSEFGGSLTESLCDNLKYNHQALGARAGSPYKYATNYDYMSPSNNSLSGWAQAMNQIRYINQFLSLMDKYSTFSQEKNERWEAEARFFRAYSYFQIAKRYGTAVIWETLPTGPDKELASADDLYDFIEADLDYAARHLPEVWDSANTGRITSLAAKAFLSRVALYAERWQTAYDAADEVIQSHKFQLVSNYANSWKGNNSEAVIQFFYAASNGPSNNWDSYYSAVPAKNPFTTGSVGVPTQEMVECYEDTKGNKVDWSAWHAAPTTQTPPYDQLEPRFKATVIYRGAKWMGVTMDCSVDGVNGIYQEFGEAPYAWNRTTTGYFLRKMCDESHTDLQSVNGSQTWVALRYAEVYLNKAEAAYRLNMIGDAQEAMNEVRKRVGLPGKYTIGDAWFADYRNERKVELAYEGQLYWDMRRWRLAHTEYDHYRQHGFRISTDANGDAVYEYVPVDLDDRRFNAKTYRFPLPPAEVRDNALVDQFPEWK